MTAAQATTSLPFELIALIIEHAQDDKATLISCSLACHTLSEMTRQLIFREVALYGETDAVAFAGLVEASQPVAKCVQSLRLSSSVVTSEDHRFWLSNSPSLPIILRICTGIHKLSIHEMYFFPSFIESDFQDALSSLPIRHLSLKTAVFQSISILDSLIAKFPHLDLLENDGVFVTFRNDDEDTMSPVVPRLVSRPLSFVRVAGQTDRSPAISFRSVGEAFGQIHNRVEHLSIHLENGNDCDLALGLLPHVVPELAHLDFTLLTADHSRLQASLAEEEFYLSIPHLQSLRIKGITDLVPEWLFFCLEHFEMDSLTEIGLDLSLLSFESPAISARRDWRRLEAILSSPRFQRLKTVKLSFAGVSPGYVEDLEAIWAKPLFKGKQQVHIEPHTPRFIAAV